MRMRFTFRCIDRSDVAAAPGRKTWLDGFFSAGDNLDFRLLCS
jgi:hypothetical protein